MKTSPWIMGLVFSIWPIIAAAEPISFEQAANVTGGGGIQMGFDLCHTYKYLEGASNTLTELPIFVRAGIPWLEGRLTIPYGNVYQLGDIRGSGEFTGIEDVGLMLKSCVISLPAFSLALGVDSTFPTGDPTRYLGAGLNINPFLAAGGDAGIIKIYANVGYRFLGEYSLGEYEMTRFDGYSFVRVKEELNVKPGDTINFALGLEIPTSEFVSLHAEVNGVTYKDRQFNGRVLAGSSGVLISVVPGVRLHIGPFKAKFGIEVPLWDKANWPTSTQEYDWRLLSGMSLQYSLR
jgi:hypothetical protein